MKKRKTKKPVLDHKLVLVKWLDAKTFSYGHGWTERDELPKADGFHALTVGWITDSNRKGINLIQSVGRVDSPPADRCYTHGFFIPRGMILEIWEL